MLSCAWPIFSLPSPLAEQRDCLSKLSLSFFSPQCSMSLKGPKASFSAAPWSWGNMNQFHTKGFSFLPGKLHSCVCLFPYNPSPMKVNSNINFLAGMSNSKGGEWGKTDITFALFYSFLKSQILETFPSRWALSCLGLYPCYKASVNWSKILSTVMVMSFDLKTDLLKDWFASLNYGC